MSYRVITTKYLGPTNCRGSRIKATDDYSNESYTMGYQHEHGIFENHELAAEMLCEQIGVFIDTKMISGQLKNGYVFLTRYTNE
jgi:hypothetical protein